MPKEKTKRNHSDALNERIKAEMNEKVAEFEKLMNTDWKDIETNPDYEDPANYSRYYFDLKDHFITSKDYLPKEKRAELSFIFSEINNCFDEYKEEHEHEPWTLENAFKIIKVGYLKGRTAYDKHVVETSFTSKEDPFERLYGEGSIFKEMEDCLDSGDKFYRGSSDAYKEIQREVKSLKNKLNTWGDSIKNDPEKKQYAHVMIQALREKATDYLNDRRHTGLKNAANGYKGKRIDNMWKVYDRLNAMNTRMKELDYINIADYSHEMSNQFKTAISKKLDTTTFSKVLFSEYAAVKSKKTTLGQTISKSDEIASSDATKTMKTALKGKILGSTTLFNMWTKVKNAFTKADDDIKNAKEQGETEDFHKNREANSRKLATMREDVGSITYHLDRMVYENPIEYTGKDIGDYDLDMLVLKQVNQKYDAAASEVEQIDAETQVVQ